MQINPSSSFQWPFLQIIAGEQSLAVMDPTLDVYIGTHPPASLEKTAVVRFSHPHPVGARLMMLFEDCWCVYSDPGPVTLLNAAGQYQYVPPLEDYINPGIRRENHNAIDLALHFSPLRQGLNRLVFDGREEALLLVPENNPNILSAGSLIDVASRHEKKGSEAVASIDTEMEKARADRQEWVRLTGEVLDLVSALKSKLPDAILNFLSRALHMAFQRRNHLSDKLRYYRPSGEAADDAALDQIPKLQPLTDEEYKWALDFARSR